MTRIDLIGAARGLAVGFNNADDGSSTHAPARRMILALPVSSPGPRTQQRLCHIPAFGREACFTRETASLRSVSAGFASPAPLIQLGAVSYAASQRCLRPLASICTYRRVLPELRSPMIGAKAPAWRMPRVTATRPLETALTR